MPEMTGGDAAYYALRALGVDTVFGIPSVHNIPIYDSILRNSSFAHFASGKRESPRMALGLQSLAPGKARHKYSTGIANRRLHVPLSAQVKTATLSPATRMWHAANAGANSFFLI